MEKTKNHLQYIPKSLLLSWLIMIGCNNNKEKVHSIINDYGAKISIKWEKFLGSINENNTCLNVYGSKSWYTISSEKPNINIPSNLSTDNINSNQKCSKLIK